MRGKLKSCVWHFYRKDRRCRILQLSRLRLLKHRNHPNRSPGIETPGADTSNVETDDVTKREETKLVLEGSALGEGASFAYVPNGFAQYSSMGVFEIDKTKLSAGCKIVLNYTAVEGDTDVAATQGFILD